MGQFPYKYWNLSITNNCADVVWYSILMEVTCAQLLFVLYIVEPTELCKPLDH